MGPALVAVAAASAAAGTYLALTAGGLDSEFRLVLSGAIGVQVALVGGAWLDAANNFPRDARRALIASAGTFLGLVTSIGAVIQHVRFLAPSVSPPPPLNSQALPSGPARSLPPLEADTPLVEPSQRPDIVFVPGGLAGGPGPNSDMFQLMPRFPWPPPAASATEVIRPDLIGDVRNLFQIGQVLERVLLRQQYEYRYYAIPGGFLMFCRMERINDDGSPASGDRRWLYSNIEPWSFTSIGQVLRGLFRAPRGYFRIIAMAVTSTPIMQDGVPLTSEESFALMRRGWDRLPEQMSRIPTVSDTRITALIYEFRSEGYDSVVRLEIPGRIGGRIHLERAGLWTFAAR